MEIHYVNKTVEAFFTDFSLSRKKLGDAITKQLKKRLDQLKAFSDLKELFGSGLDNPEFLQGDLKGRISWRVDAHRRLILELVDQKPDENMFRNLSGIQKINLKGVVDYHDGKNEWIVD